ncbi:MAG: N-acetylmuramoyl-L-alanine amidase [Hyphomicrobiaceae bacterium]
MIEHSETNPGEHFGDVFEEEADLLGYSPIDGYVARDLGPGSQVDRGATRLWYPEAVTTFEMPSRGRYKDDYPKGAVVHFTAGRCDDGDPHAEQTIRHGAGQGHCYFCISQTGRVYQTAPLSHWGYHAGKSYHAGLGSSLSAKLVGIEVCCAGRVNKTANGYEPWWNKPGASSNNYYVEEQVRFAIAGENITETGHYHKYTQNQEVSLVKLLMWLHQNCPSVFEIGYVLGHDEIAPQRKNDPGGSLSLTMPQLRVRLQKEIRIPTS